MFRKWVTPLTAGSFLLMGITGIFMFFNIRPGLVSPLHEWLGILFVASVLLHLWLNWKPMKAHWHRPLGKALVLLFAVLTALAFVIPSFEHEGPDGPLTGRTIHVVLPALLKAPVGQLAGVAGITPAEAHQRLQAIGLKDTSDTTPLSKMAQAGGISPDKALLAIFASPQQRDRD